MLQKLSHAGNGAASAHSRHKNIHFAVPDLRTGCGLMNLRIGRVHELSWNKASGDFSGELLRLGDSALHPLDALCQHQLRSISLHQLPPFHRHGFRHGDDQPVTLGRGHRSQANAGIAAGRLDDDRALPQKAFFLCVLDHRLSDSILDAPRRVKVFQLCQQNSLQSVGFFYASQF